MSRQKHISSIMKSSGPIIVGCIFLASIIYVSALMDQYKPPMVLYSFNGVQLTPDNAPRLSSIFEDGSAGPHASFISNESCEKCHTENTGTDIMGKTIPSIPHEIVSNCSSCHIMAGQ